MPKGTRVYVRAYEHARIDTHDDAGTAVSVVWWRDRKYPTTGKQWLSWQRERRCLRRVQFAGDTGPARLAREWDEALAAVADRPYTVTTVSRAPIPAPAPGVHVSGWGP
jgi:hypothetical protein